MEGFLERIRQELPEEEATACLRLLLRALGNILQHPSEARFRALRRSSRAVAERLCPSPAAAALLLAVGFEEDADGWTFPPDAAFDAMVAAVDALQSDAAVRAEPATPRSPAEAVQPPVRPVQRRAAAPACGGDAAAMAELRRLRAQQYKDRDFLAVLGPAQGEGTSPAAPAQPTPTSGGVSPAASTASPAASPAIGGERPRTAFQFAAAAAKGERERARTASQQSIADLRRERADMYRERRTQGDAAPQPPTLPEVEDGATPSDAAAVSGWAWLPDWTASPRGGGQLKRTEGDARTFRL